MLTKPIFTRPWPFASERTLATASYWALSSASICSSGWFACWATTAIWARKPASVYVRADSRVPYGDVVRVLAVIRTSGVRDVGLVAQDETAP